MRKIKAFFLTLIFCTIPGIYLGWQARSKVASIPNPVEIVMKNFNK